MKDFSEFLPNLFVSHIAIYFFSTFLKPFSEFSQIRVCATPPWFPYRSFKIFFRINGKLSCNISKAPTKNMNRPEISEKFLKKFDKIISRILSKSLENYLPIS